MPQPRSILGGIGAVVQALLAAIARFFASLFQSELKIVDNIEGIVDDFDAAKRSIEAGIEKLKNFSFDPKWKNRVINVPIAVKQMQQFLDDSFSDFKGRLEKLRDPFHQLKLIFSADSAESGDPNQAVSGFTKTAVKVDEIATLVQQVKTAMDQIKDFADFFDKTVDQLQKLDALFLQQGNQIKVAKGVTVRQRQGALHG